jgi:hypothetical protein
LTGYGKVSGCGNSSRRIELYTVCGNGGRWIGLFVDGCSPSWREAFMDG